MWHRLYYIWPGTNIKHSLYWASFNGCWWNFWVLGMTKLLGFGIKNQFALMVGMSELLANLAAAFGIGVATYFVVRFGWRGNMVVYGLIVLFIFNIIFIFNSTR